jgi:hypothetical protein
MSQGGSLMGMFDAPGTNSESTNLLMHQAQFQQMDQKGGMEAMSAGYFRPVDHQQEYRTPGKSVGQQNTGKERADQSQQSNVIDEDNASSDLESTDKGSGKQRRTSGSSSEKKIGGDSDIHSFLGGTFAGGWQSNEDIPARRNVIFRICSVIEQMRPDVGRVSQK